MNYRTIYKRIEGADYKNAPTVYMKPDKWNLLLNRLAEWVIDYRIRKRNPYEWNNKQYWRFVNDVAEKSAEIVTRRLKKQD